jgi:hypothetical protein
LTGHPAEIRETGRESDKADTIGGTRVYPDYVVGLQSVVLGDEVEVGTEFVVVTDRDFEESCRFGRNRGDLIQQTLEEATDDPIRSTHRRIGWNTRWIVIHSYRGVGRNMLDHPLKAMMVEVVRGCYDAQMSRFVNPFPEPDQDRRITQRRKLHG